MHTIIMLDLFHYVNITVITGKKKGMRARLIFGRMHHNGVVSFGRSMGPGWQSGAQRP
jgi:hypothetical protein